jgi:hypothetical protein
VSLVFTAHPTQAFRQSLLKKYARVSCNCSLTGRCYAVVQLFFNTGSCAFGQLMRSSYIPVFMSNTALVMSLTTGALNELHNSDARTVR